MSILQVRTEFSGGSVVGPSVGVMNFLEGVIADPAAASAAVKSFWVSCEAVMSNALTWTADTTVREFDTVTGALIALHTVGTQTGDGNISGEQLPNNCQGRIDWHTNEVVNGRELRGRTFIPAVPESLAINTPNSTYQSTVAAALATLQAVDGFCVWSRTNGVAHPVVGGELWSKFASLRSRRD